MKSNARQDIPGLVELQLLRHGPPHNQLLSPLTDYLALCGDHPNTTLRIPLEHAALETRLRALRYFDSEQTRVDQLRETARIACELLAKVPGLIAELSADRSDGAPFVHLSIVSRASELALFPFELALSPDGLPGAGQALLLQKQMPVSLTRRSRNIRNNDFVWDRKIKILMVASDAGGPIPVLQHYALLRKLVEPWVATMPGPPKAGHKSAEPEQARAHEPAKEEKEKQDRLTEEKKEHETKRRRGALRLLTNATVESIARALTEEVDDTGDPFTHIHVLAHGCDLPDADRRSGIALHDPNGREKFDAVDGKRLALTLGSLPDYPEEARRYQGPAVVTLATCGSADQGGVTIPGASLVFELHDTGIPLVVGSQFPLSEEGSIIMTEALYTGFLAGGDPRSTIWEARRALLAGLAQKPRLPGKCDGAQRAAHDWASMTVYAALPGNLDEILPTHWSRRNKLRLDARLENIQTLMRVEKESANLDAFTLWRDAAEKAAGEANLFSRWTRTLENADERARVNNSGILASAQKQIGLIWLRVAIDKVPPNAPGDEKDRDWARAGEKWLRAARAEYRRIFESQRDRTWALVQFLALDFALRSEFNKDDWTTARHLSLLDVRDCDPQRRVDALAALLELKFLRWLRANLDHPEPLVIDEHGEPRIHGDELDEAHAETAHELAGQIHRTFDDKREARGAVKSAVRQFQRYIDDFAELAFCARQAPGAGASAERLLARQGLRKVRAAKDLPLLGKPGRQAVEAIDQLVRMFADID